MTVTADDLRALKRRRDAILSKLQVISDAPMPAPPQDRVRYVGVRPPRPLGLRVNGTDNAAEIGYIPRKSAADSRPPDGVDMGACAGDSHAPSKRFSLYSHYLWRFQRARDYGTILKLCAMAEVDYLEYMGVYHRPHDESHGATVRRLLTEWRGCEDVQVAAWEGCQVKWVRRHRAINGWEPQFGDERLRVNTRTRRILELAGEGKTAKQIATALELSTSAVDRELQNV